VIIQKNAFGGGNSIGNFSMKRDQLDCLDRVASHSAGWYPTKEDMA